MCVHAAVSAKMSKSEGGLCCLKKVNSYLNKVIGWRNCCILLSVFLHLFFDIIKVFRIFSLLSVNDKFPPIIPNFPLSLSYNHFPGLIENN